MANYGNIRADYVEALPGWQLVKRCVAGAREIRKHDCYLPMPDPLNKSDENLARYDQLRKRAMFLNITGRTRIGLHGAVFRKTAECTVPAAIEYIKENATGDGSSLEQLSKDAVGECLDTGRGGFLVDFPQVALPDGQSIPPTKAQSGGYLSHIHLYDALSIVDWDEAVVGGVKKLVYVNLREVSVVFDPVLLERVEKERHRVLLLIGGQYIQRVFDDDHPDGEESTPTDKAGAAFDHIPFHFFGAQNNDPSIDKPPLEDLAEVNILHYGNSATVEEAGFISSQPTLFITTDIEHEEFMKWNPNGLHIGSTQGYNLGKSGSAVLVQAKETQLARELMKDKEDQMLMIGARIVQPSGAAETAEAVRIRYSSDSSVLSTIAGNVSEAIKLAIFDVQRFMMGAINEKKTVFWLNQAFFANNMDAQSILAQMQLWQQGIISKSVLRTSLRQSEVIEADVTDDDMDEEIALTPPVTGTEV